MNVTPGQFLVNILNVLRYEAYHNFQNLRQPVNRDKWSTEPVVVNAFYNPNKNDISECACGAAERAVASPIPNFTSLFVATQL